MKLLVVLAHIWAYAQVARVNAQQSIIFQPTSTYDSTIVNSANQTVTARTISFTCSNALPGGRLTIGNYYVDVECVPPRYQYYYDKLGNVPRGVQLMIDEVCLTDDEGAFYDSSQNPALSTLQRIANSGYSSPGATSAAGRKLLAAKIAGIKLSDNAVGALALVGAVTGVIGLGVATSALVEANKAVSTANSAWSLANLTAGKVNDLANDLTLTNNTLYSLVAWQNTTNQTLYDIYGQLDKVQQKWEKQVNITTDLTNAAIATNKTIDILRQNVQDDFKLLNDKITNSSNILQQQMNATDVQVRAQFTSVWDAISTATSNQIADANNIYGMLESANENIAGVNSILWDQMRQRQLRNLLSNSFFQHADLLPDGVSPLLKEAGLPPAASGDFPPSAQSILMERVDINFAQPLQTTSSVTNQQIKFYFNTSYALDTAKPFLTVRSLLKLIGPPGCVRAGPGGDGLPSTTNCYPHGVGAASVCCQAWIEVDTYTCTASSNTFKFSQSSSGDAQDSVLYQGAPCVDVPGAPSKQLITDSSSFFDFVNQQVCTPAATNGEYMIRSLQTQRIAYVAAPNATACALTYQGQADYTGSATAWKWLLNIYSYAYVLFQPLLSNYDQQLNGRLPGGLSFETVPFVYTPPKYDAVTGNLVLNGQAEPSVCHYAYWISATDAVAPVYSVTAVPGNNIQKLVIVNITQIDYQAPQPGDTIVPGSLQVYEGNGGQVILSNDASNLLPGNILLIGNLNDDVLYDVPEVLMDASRSASARANKATYYMMDPNTTTTWTLPQWIEQYGDVFRPLDAAVNPADYAYLSLRAADGYPFCGISGAEPTVTELLGIDNAPTCVAGFIRQNASSTQVATLNATGNQCSFGTIIYNTPTNTSLASFTETWKTGVYTYSYWFQSTVNAPSSSGFFNALGAAYAAGVNVNIGVTTGTNANNVFGYPYIAFGGVTAQGKQSLTDGVPHHIAWVFDNTGKTATLYVDGYKSQVFAWDISGITFSGTPTFTPFTAPNIYTFAKSTTATSSPEIQRLSLCQMSVISSHCTNAGGQEQYVIARQTNPAVTSMSCTPSTLVFTTDLYRTYNPQPSIAASFMTDAAWSLSFWVYSTYMAQGTTQQLFAINGPYYGLGATFSNPDGQGTRVGITIYSNNAPLTIDAGLVLTGASGWHNLIVSSFNGTVVIYADAQPSASLQYTFSSTTAIGAQWAFNATGNYAYLQYYQSFFDTNAVYNEYHCQMTSNVDTFSPPVGYCRVGGTSQGYCRYINSCNGNCEVLSTINQASATFVAGVNVCDNGYNAPTCLTSCSHYDAASGNCVGVFDTTSAQGVIPNSEWCLFLRDYQVSTGFVDPDTKRQTLFATPRSWSYMATVAVPQGKIVSEVATAVCPSVQLSGNAGQGASVILTNSAGVTAPVRVTQGQQTPDNSTGTDLNCYNIDGQGFFSPKQQTAVLPPFASYAMQISVCPNMTLAIDIQQLVGNTLVWESCTTLDQTYVDAGVQVPTSLPNDVSTVITTAISKVQNDQAQLAATLYINTLQLMAMLAQSFNASSVLQEFIANQSAGVAAITINPTNFSALFNQDFNLATPDYLAAQAEIGTALADANKNNNDINLLNSDTAKGLQTIRDDLAEESKRLNDTINNLQKLNESLSHWTDLVPASALSVNGSGLSVTDILLITFGSILGLGLLYYGYQYYYGGKAASGTAIKYMKLGNEGTFAKMSHATDEATETLKRRLTLNFKRQQQFK